MNASVDSDLYWQQTGPAPKAVHMFVGLFVLFTTIISVGTNALVIVAYLWNWRLNLSFRAYLLTMSVSDSVGPATTSWMFVFSSFSQRWLFGQFGCSVYGFTQGVSALISISTIAAIAGQRCFGVCFPTRARVLFATPSYHIKVVAFIHLYAFLAAVPPLLGWGRYSTEGLLTSCCFEFIQRTTAVRLYILYLYTLGFHIPLAVILLAFFKLRRYYTKRASLTINTNRTVKEELKVTRVMTVVSVGFLAAWTPYAVMALIGQFGLQTWTIHPYTATVVSLLAKTASIYNPIIYAYGDPKFRQTVKDMFCNVHGSTQDQGPKESTVLLLKHRSSSAAAYRTVIN